MKEKHPKLLLANRFCCKNTFCFFVNKWGLHCIYSGKDPILEYERRVR
jgi:hypothetical protein